MGRKTISGFLILSLVGITLSSSVGYLGSEYWFLDLFSHFKVQYSVILLVLTTGFLILKNKVAVVIGLVLFSVNIIDILPLYFGSQPKVKQESQVSVCSINLLSSNGSFELVGDYIKKEQPDILVLEELSELWEIALDTILSDFQYKLSMPRSDNFGIGLYSKIKLDTVHSIIVNDALLPSILCRFTLAEDNVNLLATHPLPPVGKFEFESRNNALERIAILRNSLEGHFILVGDLNITSFSTHFKKLLAAAELQDSRRGFGVLNTWHSEVPILKIALDHCLVSDGLVVSDRKVGPNIGSDHFPISMTVGIKKW